MKRVHGYEFGGVHGRTPTTSPPGSRPRRSGTRLRNGRLRLRFRHRGVGRPAATYERVFAAFTEKTGVKIDYQPVINFDQQLQSRASTKDLPDGSCCSRRTW
ncbi:hypothetical protein ABZX77_45575 [Streptomyces sp. NPDC004237]|uniref:hypothetical protein n=1 Tax=Streptomyces sp. NPDC004237 TaxID=3154455 RepID=UPI0033AE2939